MDRTKQIKAFERLLDVMDAVRERCPWDREQTIESLRPNTIEEVYELSDAIMNNDLENLCKELGDVLLHIVFYAKIGSEIGKFDIADVCNKLCDKLVYRHPHVFGDAAAKDAAEVLKNWEQIKRTEKDGNKTVLSGVPNSLPTLIKAYRIQDKARAVGFDWKNKEDVWEKVSEEISEFKEELASMGSTPSAKESAEKELGDLLFSIVNAARLYDLNPDTALEATCTKFKNRFTYLETESKADGKDLKSMSLEEMEEYWQKSKEQYK